MSDHPKKINTAEMRVMLAQVADKALERKLSKSPRTQEASFDLRDHGEGNVDIDEKTPLVTAEFAADLEAENAGLRKALAGKIEDWKERAAVNEAKAVELEQEGDHRYLGTRCWSQAYAKCADELEALRGKGGAGE